MKVGEHSRMIISPDLCYGSKGFYPLISANSALIVQVRFHFSCIFLACHILSPVFEVHRQCLQVELLASEPSDPAAAMMASTVAAGAGKARHEHVV